jgi:PAS domain S-box-containing protein
MRPEPPEPSPIFAGIFDAMDAGIVAVDAQRRIVLWNHWIARASGIDAGSASGRMLEELFPDAAAGRLPLAVAGALESGTSSFLSHGLHPSLLPLRYPDGRPILHNLRVRPLTRGGQVFCLVQIDDVTDAVRRETVLRERQNARYRAVVDSATDAIITTNDAGLIQWMNAAAERHFQFNADETIGQPIGMLLADAGQWPTGPADDRATGQIVEATGRRKDGSAVHLEISNARWASEGRVFVTGILRDVTDRKLAAEALQRLNEELEQKVEKRTREREEALEKWFRSQKNESIGQLTGGLAHDFNNLLAAILGNLDLLRKRLPDEAKFRRLIDGAIHGAERGASLTKRLLMFARRTELEPESVSVRGLINEMEDLLQRSLGGEIQVKTDIPDDLPAVRVDANQLELALLNVAVNARDAMPFGGTLLIAAAPETFGEDVPVDDLVPGDYVRISITDSGVGMDETILAKAQEPFFTTKGPGKGTGLGLPMVHGLAVESGGAIRLSSKPGKGTTVDLWLPKPTGDEKSKPARKEWPSPQVVPRHCRVLLVDDDALVRMGTADMLEDLGHEVIEANSATEALSLLEATPGIDLVITDQAMPGMRGTELAARIAQVRPSLPVILATGYADLPRGEGTALPRLSKPFRQEDVAAAVGKVMGPAADPKVVVLRR